MQCAWPRFSRYEVFVANLQCLLFKTLNPCIGEHNCCPTSQQFQTCYKTCEFQGLCLGLPWNPIRKTKIFHFINSHFYPTNLKWEIPSSCQGFSKMQNNKQFLRSPQWLWGVLHNILSTKNHLTTIRHSPSCTLGIAWWLLGVLHIICWEFLSSNWVLSTFHVGNHLVAIKHFWQFTIWNHLAAVGRFSFHICSYFFYSAKNWTTN